MATATKKKKSPVSKEKKKTVSGPLKNKLTRTEIITLISENTGLTKSQVKVVFEEWGDIVFRSLGKNGSGVITAPNGLYKLERKKKPARKQRKGINPFTGLEQVFAATPAKTVPKLKALKALKEAVSGG